MSTITKTPAPDAAAPTPRHPLSSPSKRRQGAFGPAQLLQALPGAFRKLDPRQMWRNPVMFLVEVGAALTTVLAIAEPFLGGPGSSGGTEVPLSFTWAIAVWLWLTVLFANLAESVAEGRGKAQADTLRQTRTSTVAHVVTAYDEVSDDLDTALARLLDPAAAPTERTPLAEVSSAELKLGDIVVVTAGELIPGDGDIVWGIASVDESAITGESAPVVRESGGDRSAVTGGTRVLSDRIVVRITSKPGETFVDRMIALVEGASRQKTPNEIALNILLASLSIIFVVVTLTLNPIASYAASPVSIPVLIALLVCLIPTTIGALLSAIGIAGMDRLVQRNVLAMSGRAVEAAGDVTTLLLDKTGTITYGNRRASEFVPMPGVDAAELVRAAALSSLADPTPEGTSIVDLAAERGIRFDPSTLREAQSTAGPGNGVAGEVVPFTAQTRMSGLDLPDGLSIRKGAASAIRTWISQSSGQSSLLDGSGRSTSAHSISQEVELARELEQRVEAISNSGGTPLVVATKDPDGRARILGVVHLKDVVKDGLTERFAELRAMGIRTVMITGDNPLTAKAIAAEAGVDDYLAEATPEDKMALIRRAQEGGDLVAMTGDGTNDAPALAQADVGVAMNTGTSAAKEAGNMVDLDSDPTKLIEIVRIGKQLLITRGALTTFSIANDVAKYFAIIPAMFAGIFPGLAVLNIMQLHSPASAILSAIIFNALVIVALIPLALRGVRYRPGGASAILSRNLLVYGLGGIIAPFIGIKLIDLVVSLIPGF
ncbi:potassium-transporting ATPase subunit KdpB [Agromyces neolithicus]|uniref:Potassium-transporting ATPase ATP-binding subunit n=1 Tax=Agromyces neolithicus TaxID=269420 RepID=A0ABN2M4V1_9MICO